MNAKNVTKAKAATRNHLNHLTLSNKKTPSSLPLCSLLFSLCSPSLRDLFSQLLLRATSYLSSFFAHPLLLSQLLLCVAIAASCPGFATPGAKPVKTHRFAHFHGFTREVARLWLWRNVLFPPANCCCCLFGWHGGKIHHGHSSSFVRNSEELSFLS